MRLVIQRVASAEVRVDGKSVGKIGAGLLLFLGIEKMDTQADAGWLAEKVPAIRCFEDEDGRMNRNVGEIGGGLLVISQFTLFGSLRKGTRPSFNRAAPPEQAVPLYEYFTGRLESITGHPVQTGIFGAEMKIDALNDGPVTLVIDTKNRDF